jgi:hypothetical protein
MGISTYFIHINHLTVDFCLTYTHTRRKSLGLVLSYEPKTIFFLQKIILFYLKKKCLGMETLVLPGDDQVKY